MDYKACVDNIKERITLLLDNIHTTIENEFVGRDVFLIEDELRSTFDGVSVTFLDRHGNAYDFEELIGLDDEVESAVIQPAKSFPLNNTNAVILAKHALIYESDFIEGTVFVEIAIDLVWKDEDDV